MPIASPRRRAESAAFATVIAVLAALVFVISCGMASAHAFKTSGAAIYFDRETGRFSFDLHLNLEAVLARIDP